MGRAKITLEGEILAGLERLNHSEYSALSIVCYNANNAYNLLRVIQRWMISNKNRGVAPSAVGYSAKLYPPAKSLVIVHSAYKYARRITYASDAMVKEALWNTIPIDKTLGYKTSSLRLCASKEDFDKAAEILNAPHSKKGWEKDAEIMQKVEKEEEFESGMLDLSANLA